MNQKLIALTLAGAGLTGSAMGQGLPGRAFTYDGSDATNGNIAYIVNGDGHHASVFSGVNDGTESGQNRVKHPSKDAAEFLARTLINVSTYVYISGNFGGVYTVSGFGSATDSNTYNTDVEIRTNRSLALQTDGFYGLGNSIGTVTYGLSLFQDFPSNGVQIGPTVTGADRHFNHNRIGLNAATDLPADGKATLRLSRKLSLTQAALGGQTLTVAGFIQVDVN